MSLALFESAERCRCSLRIGTLRRRKTAGCLRQQHPEAVFRVQFRRRCSEVQSRHHDGQDARPRPMTAIMEGRDKSGAANQSIDGNAMAASVVCNVPPRYQRRYQRPTALPIFQVFHGTPNMFSTHKDLNVLFHACLHQVSLDSADAFDQSTSGWLALRSIHAPSLFYVSSMGIHRHLVLVVHGLSLRQELASSGRWSLGHLLEIQRTPGVRTDV